MHWVSCTKCGVWIQMSLNLLGMKCHHCGTGTFQK